MTISFTGRTLLHEVSWKVKEHVQGMKLKYERSVIMFSKGRSNEVLEINITILESVSYDFKSHTLPVRQPARNIQLV